MSTTHSNTVELPDSVSTSNGSRGWRIADGHFARGREEDNNLETKDSFLGYLTRVGIHEGELDDGRKYAKLEMDLDCRSGTESIGATLLSATAGKPSYSQCIQLAQIVLSLKPGQLVQVQTNLASQKNRFGKFQTFLNGYFVDPITLKPTRMQFERNDGDIDAILKGLVSQIRAHDAYQDRPKREDDGGDVFANEPTTKTNSVANQVGEFEAVIVEKAWPSMDGPANNTYLDMARAIAKKSNIECNIGTYSDIPAAILDAMTEQARGAKDVPKLLKPFITDTEVDPFA
jgi:hypothetical protein